MQCLPSDYHIKGAASKSLYTASGKSTRRPQLCCLTFSQSQVHSLGQGLFGQEQAEASGRSETLDHLSQDQNYQQTKRPTRSRGQQRRLSCPEAGCGSTFIKRPDLVRHRFTRTRFRINLLQRLLTSMNQITTGTEHVTIAPMRSR